MASMIFLLCVLAVSALEVDADALFPGSDFDSFKYAGRFNTSATLQKRYDQARFTYFDTGLGACGSTNSPSDFIVALNSPQYGNGEHCYEMIEITYNGKTAQAQIVDECPGCPWAALDFSEGLFEYFASLDKGVIYGSWVFAGEATTTKQTPTQTQTKATSSSSTPEGTETETPPTRTSSHEQTVTATATTSSRSTSSASSPTPSGLEQLNLAMESVLRVIVFAAT